MIQCMCVYRCAGRVTSLNGHPLEGVVVTVCPHVFFLVVYIYLYIRIIRAATDQPTNVPWCTYMYM